MYACVCVCARACVCGVYVCVWCMYVVYACVCVWLGGCVCVCARVRSGWVYNVLHACQKRIITIKH